MNIYENNYVGEPVKITDKAASFTEEYKYNPIGNKVSAKGNDGAEYKYEYDLSGNLKSETDPMGNKKEYTYKNGMLTEEKIPVTSTESSIKFYEYDEIGNVSAEGIKSSKTGESKKTSYEYDKMSRLKKVTLANNDYTEYEYDNMGNTTKVVTGNGSNETKYEYNYRNQPTKVIYPSGKYETYKYDNIGNMTEKTDRNGTVTKYTYDSIGNITKETASKNGVTNTHEMTYGLTGAMIKDKNENMEISYVYGETGNTKEESYKLGENNYLISYARNNDGTIGGKILYSSKGKISTNWLYDAKSHTKYTYDKRGRMTQVTEFTNPTSTFSSTKTKYSYDLNGNRTKTEYGNGLTTEYVYNKAGMLTEMKNNKNGSNIETLKYDYYYDGNIKNETVTGNMRPAYNKTYTYDKIGRLTGENKTGSESININYEYDLNGNRTSMTYDGVGTGNNAFKANYTYDSDNRLLTERKNYTKRNETEITQYTYDNNGNQVNKLTGISAVYGNNQVSANISDINELSSGEYENRKYNLFNQLTDVSINGKESKYTYRPDGLRLTKTADGKTTGYIWDEGKIYAETNDLFEIQTAYIYGNERINSNNGIYYLYNGHGDVTGLADTTGNITKTYNYDAFGVELNLDSEDVNPFRYCGEYYDKETDSIYLRARYYNPVLGRFTTEDPAKDGLNWYAYCGNNPVMFIDPSGLDSYVICSIYEDDANETDRNRRQAEIIKAEFEEKYGTPCHIIEIYSAEDFVDSWNELPKDDFNNPIDAVEIISHGHVNFKNSNEDNYLIGYIYFSDGSRFYAAENNSMTEKDRSINDIESKSIRYLYFSACNTANSDFKVNIAQAFYDKNPNVRTVAGWDGGVVFIFKWKRLFTVNKDFSTASQETFEELRKYGDNRKPGLRVFNHYYWAQG